MKFKHAWLNWRKLVVDDRNLSFGAKGVALYLNTYMNDSHDMAFPSLATIRGELSIGSNSTLIKYLDELENAGYLQRQKRFSKTTIYHAVVPTKISSITDSVVLQNLDNSITESVTPVLQNLESNKQENKQKNKQVGGSGRKRPSLAEVEMLVEEKGYHFDPEQFFNHYEAIGWVYGKNKIPIKKWQACAVQWEQRHKEKNPDRKQVRRDATGKVIEPTRRLL